MSHGHQWSPYQMNGGNCLAIAGKDFSLICADTRQSVGFNILSRDEKKLHKLTTKTVVGCCGMQADSIQLTRNLGIQLELYKRDHDKECEPKSIAQLLAIMLYQKRFFPYYVWNIVAGIDKLGGAVFSYDPVGNFERVRYVASGSAQTLLQPFLDQQIGFKHQQEPHPEGKIVDPPYVSKEKAIAVAKDAFIAATERDIETGDGYFLLM